MKKILRNLVIGMAAFVVAFAMASPAFASKSYYYTNSSHNRVHVPTYQNTVPAGASAHCRDGSYSYSQHRRGTCSGHHGVASWL